MDLFSLQLQSDVTVDDGTIEAWFELHGALEEVDYGEVLLRVKLLDANPHGSRFADLQQGEKETRCCFCCF